MNDDSKQLAAVQARATSAPSAAVPADATPEEWAAAVRVTFAKVRGVSSLQGIPSHWLDAMRDAALALKIPGNSVENIERPISRAASVTA